MVKLELPALAQDMHQAAAVRDVEALRRRAHTLMGMAGNLSAVALAGLARQLGPAAVAGHWGDVARLLERVDARAAAFGRLFPDAGAA